MLLSIGAQEAIYCRCTYGEQLNAALLAMMQGPAPLERFDQDGSEGDQSFGADLIGAFQARRRAC